MSYRVISYDPYSPFNKRTQIAVLDTFEAAIYMVHGLNARAKSQQKTPDSARCFYSVEAS